MAYHPMLLPATSLTPGIRQTIAVSHIIKTTTTKG